MECSSKEMVGVDEIFEEAIVTVVNNDRSNVQNNASQPGKTVGQKRKRRTCRLL